MAFSPQFLDELRDRISLVDLVGRRVRLTRKGREHQGLCPFHNEKTPSFYVYDDHYHCFGCAAHGSAIDFVMETEGVAFPEAVERLAQAAGMEIPAERPEERERARRAKGLLDVMEAASRYFERQLRMPAGRAARDYLQARGIAEATIARFRLGVAPDDRNALKTALARDGVEEDAMIEAGLRIRPEDGERPTYDRFRGRLIFPITDGRGRVVAFGGRILGAGEPKYLNSPETPLFHKRRTLYGLFQARDAARAAQEVVVAEGYTDVLALAQAGLGQAVAPLGTALTEAQMGLLWKVAPALVLCFDGDRAGREAALHAVERALGLLRPGYTIRVALLPDGEDPDSLIKAGGAAAMEVHLAEAEGLADFLWRRETEGRRLDTPDAKAALEKRLNDHAEAIGDATLRAHYRKDFNNRLWPPKVPWTRRGRTPADTAPRMAERSGAAIHVDAKRLREQMLLATLITHPDLQDALDEPLGTLNFSSPDLEKLRQGVLNILAGETGLDFKALEAHLCDVGLAEVAKGVLSDKVFDHAVFARPGEPSETALRGWEETLALYKRDQLQAEIREAEQRLAETPSEEAFRQLRALKELERQGAERGLAETGSGRRAGSVA